jgi:hypothetical protein
MEFFSEFGNHEGVFDLKQISKSGRNSWTDKRSHGIH